MSKNKIIKEIIDDSTDDDLTIPKYVVPKKPKKVIEVEEQYPIIDEINTKSIRLNKSGKPRAEYVLTEKRKKQFEIARNARMQNIELKRNEQNEHYSKYDELKKELDKKRIKKLEKIKQKELIKLMAETENISTDSDSSESIKKPIRKSKPPKKPTRKVKKVESDTESESEPEPKPKQKSKPKLLPAPIAKPMLRYC